MAESAAGNAAEVVRATPPPSAGDAENGVDTDTVSFLIMLYVHAYGVFVYNYRWGLKRIESPTHLHRCHVLSCHHQRLQRKELHLKS